MRPCFFLPYPHVPVVNSFPAPLSMEQIQMEIKDCPNGSKSRSRDSWIVCALSLRSTFSFSIFTALRTEMLRIRLLPPNPVCLSPLSHLPRLLTNGEISAERIKFATKMSARVCVTKSHFNNHNDNIDNHYNHLAAPGRAQFCQHWNL